MNIHEKCTLQQCIECIYTYERALCIGEGVSEYMVGT